MGDERDEVGPERREAAQLLRRVALGRVGAHVLHGETDLPAEERDEVDLVGRERMALVAGDREHPERLAARRERRDDARPKPDAGELPLLRIARIRVHVPADDRLSILDDVLEHRARDRARRPTRIEVSGLAPGVRHHDRVLAVHEDDGEAREPEDAAQLAEEAVEGLLLVERGRERAGDPVDRLELVGAAPELVSELLRLDGPRLGGRGFAPEARGEPADGEPDEHLEAERDEDRVEVEVSVVAVGAQRLPEGEERCEEEGDDHSAGDAEADRSLRDGQVEHLPDRRVRLPRVVDDDEHSDDDDVETERAEPE